MSSVWETGVHPGVQSWRRVRGSEGRWRGSWLGGKVRMGIDTDVLVEPTTLEVPKELTPTLSSTSALPRRGSPCPQTQMLGKKIWDFLCPADIQCPSLGLCNALLTAAPPASLLQPWRHPYCVKGKEGSGFPYFFLYTAMGATFI